MESTKSIVTVILEDINGILAFREADGHGFILGFVQGFIEFFTQFVSFC